jgi:hypothetical protein
MISLEVGHMDLVIMPCKQTNKQTNKTSEKETVCLKWLIKVA